MVGRVCFGGAVDGRETRDNVTVLIGIQTTVVLGGERQLILLKQIEEMSDICHNQLISSPVYILKCGAPSGAAPDILS